MRYITSEHDRIEVSGLAFTVHHEPDEDAGEPWKNCDGHGPVSDWTSRDKAPGERVLASDNGRHLLYDFAEACKIARRDQWGADGSTTRERAAAAAEADYEYLRRYCTDQWCYVGVVVELLDTDGNGTGETESLWGIESDSGDYLDETARELAEVIAERVGKRRKFITTGSAAHQCRIRVRAAA